MMRPVTRRALALLSCFLVFHLLYTIAYPRLRRSGYLDRNTVWVGNDKQIPFEYNGPATNSSSRPRAAFVVLARNLDLHNLRPSIRAMEDRFNRHHNYDWVFLNEVKFTDEFIELTSSLTKSKTKYGLIPKEHWSYPDWIDVEKADAARAKMHNDKVIYGGSLPYRHMCRYNSGFFFRHPLLAEYQYYWRVEPSVEFHCDLTEDPFEYMHRTGKKYGFTLSLYEYEATIPTLWNTVKEFIVAHPEHIPEQNAIKFISDNNGQTYNLCHFWSNFEIASLDLWRSKAYMDYFDFLDKKGGFFYERWGDAPVHSIAAALFLRKDEIHFFNSIGYKHNPFMHCPSDKNLQLQCHCNPAESFDYHGYSCLKRFEAVR